MEKVDCVVAGAGVVGLAVARALAMRGREVLVLESANAFGTGVSARNSEVIHAGIYYQQHSLKARMCVSGRKMLYEYCATHAVPHKRIGKLIVATNPAQIALLQEIRQRAERNGLDDLTFMSAREAMELEPELHCSGAIHSPSTGIVDSHALMLSLLGGLENHGGFLVLKTAVTHIEKAGDALIIIASDGTKISATSFVNSAGLGACDLAKQIECLAPNAIPQPRYAKGHYFSVTGTAPFSRLIYPIPEPGGLGVHLTLDLAGQARFGPDVEWVDSAYDFSVPPDRSEVFYEQVRKYWPGLPDHSLQPSYAGIRPKVAFQGVVCEDFVIQTPEEHGVPGLVNLLGIESPGLTSALAIGAHVASIFDPR